MEIKDKIREAIKKALKELGLPEVEVQLDYPTDGRYGDYSTNIALVLAKNLKKNPTELANQIVEMLNTKYKIQNTDRAEMVTPGFINFYLSKEYLLDQLGTPLKGQALQNKKIMVEYTDPNPFKEFHVGHLYSNAVGEALCRLLESQGAEVRRVNYQGDVGLHVAKAIYGLLSKIKNQKSKIKNMEELKKLSLKERVEFMGEAYTLGSNAYEESEEAKKEIHALNKKIYDQDSSIRDIYQKGRQWSLDYFETIYKRLGTKFTGYYFESKAGQVGLVLVKEHIKDGVFKESEGAIIFEGEKYARPPASSLAGEVGRGLHNRVFINSLGLPTYEAKELGLNFKKFQDYPFDLSIIVTGNEINEYFKVLLKAMERVIPEVAKKTKHIGHGMVRLPTGKMSSRKGDVITGEWLLNEAKQKIQDRYKQMDNKTAEKVAVGAIKYALLKSGIGKDIAFSFEESISLEGNSGPYLQYTYARTQSVLSKLKTQNSKLKTTAQISKLNAEELAILRAMVRFPEVVEEAAEKFAPNLLCTYLFDLAQKFNLFYQKHPILSEVSRGIHFGGVLGRTPRDYTSQFRVALTAGVGQVLKTGLDLLGIQAPERM